MTIIFTVVPMICILAPPNGLDISPTLLALVYCASKECQRQPIQARLPRPAPQCWGCTISLASKMKLRELTFSTIVSSVSAVRIDYSMRKKKRLQALGRLPPIKVSQICSTKT
eukprot:GHVT01058833.1.p1 GENE.GHVT01058833.1~~GHVT01058833.1.p1  ORF type:complete len:113 (+),score=6.46 GHVT01058833.1:448-786(+)